MTDPRLDRVGTSEGDWLAHLTSLYQLEFGLLASAVSISTIAAPVVGGFLYLLPEHCDDVTTKSDSSNCLTDTNLLAVPIIPMLLLMSFGYVYFNSRIVGKYTRALERLITSTASDSSANNTSPVTNPRLFAPALSRLTSALYGGESPRLLPLRIFYVVLAGLITGVMVTGVVLSLSRIKNDGLQVAGSVGYLLILLLSLVAYNTGADHRAFGRVFDQAILRDRRLVESASTHTYRPWPSFLGFALAPRLLSVGKESHAVVIPILWMLLVGRGSELQSKTLYIFLAGMAAFELILYQTRYLLNGVREDPTSGLDLPGNRRNDHPKPHTALQIIAAHVFAVARAYAFVALADRYSLFPGNWSTRLVILFVICFYAYEIPREIARNRYKELIRAHNITPRSPSLPDAALQVACADMSRLGWWIFVAAGAGYGLRTLAGILLLTHGQLGLLEWTAVAAAWGVGCLLVGAGWAREFLGAQSKKSKMTLHPGVVAKPQLLWAGLRLDRMSVYRLTFRLLSPLDTNEESASRLDTYSGNQHAPWRFMSVLSLWLIGLTAMVSYPKSVGVLALTLTCLSAGILLLLKQPAWPPFTFLLTLVGTLTAGLTDGMSWTGTAACTLLMWWVLLTHQQAEGGVFLDQIRAARALVDRLSKWGESLGRGVTQLFYVIFGSALVRSSIRIFGRQ